MATPDRRAAHVRARPPSDGRPRPRQVRADPPPRESLRRYRPVVSGRRLPLPVNLIMLAIVVLLGAGMLIVGSGFATGAAGKLGAAVGDALQRAASQGPATMPPAGVTLDTPQLDKPPDDGYTNVKSATISGSVPGTVAGKAGYTVRLYAVVNGSRSLAGQVPVGGTVRFGLPVSLVEGQNTFVARLDGPAGAGEESKPVVYVLDTKAPPVTLGSPANNSSTMSATVTVTGKTEPGASVSLRNAQSVATGGTKQAGSDGTFQFSVGLVVGNNTLVVSATDPAGNTTTVQRVVKRNAGKLAAHLSATPTRFAAATQQNLALTVNATASDGSPLAGAQVVFTVQVAGVGPIVSQDLTTDGSGTASFQTTIRGAIAGVGFASVLITLPDGSTVSDQVRITTY